jgi:hypothetical protein
LITFIFLALKLTCLPTQVCVRDFKASLPLQRSEFEKIREENHSFQANVAGVRLIKSRNVLLWAVNNYLQ